MKSHKRILVIDDNPDTLQLLTDVLEDHHFECRTVSSASEGLAVAETWKPDLILLDLMMPAMSGFGFLRTIKSHPGLGCIPVVVLTSLGDEDVATEAMDLGAKGFLRKVCPPREILSMVQEYV